VNETGVRVGELVRTGAGRLRASSCEAPEREAWRIWADLHEQPLARVRLARDDLADPAAVARYEAAVRRRVAGEPLAYVTGLAGFRRLTLRVDRRALIPRPETEGLVDLVLARVADGLVVDVGTGTGCIALALADEGHYDAVLALDRSAEALALAAENRDRTGLPVTLVRGDLASALGPASCDALVSNPPYLTLAEHGALEPAVRDYEPVAALASGADGLEATARVIADAVRVLRLGGWLALEVDCSRAGAGAQLASAAGLDSVTVLDDLFGRARYLLARRSEAK
jgi:release factor glutamine methyltransferase